MPLSPKIISKDIKAGKRSKKPSQSLFYSLGQCPVLFSMHKTRVPANRYPYLKNNVCIYAASSPSPMALNSSFGFALLSLSAPVPLSLSSFLAKRKHAEPANLFISPAEGNEPVSLCLARCIMMRPCYRIRVVKSVERDLFCLN